MSEEWLTYEAAAQELGCTLECIVDLVRQGVLSAKLEKKQRFVSRVKVDCIAKIPSSDRTVRVDPGMMEVSAALAGIASALAIFLLDQGKTASVQNSYLLKAIAYCTSVLAILSAINALLILARYCCEQKNVHCKTPIWGEIWQLLKSAGDWDVHWLMAFCLIIWLILSSLIFLYLIGSGIF